MKSLIISIMVLFCGCVQSRSTARMMDERAITQLMSEYLPRCDQVPPTLVRSGYHDIHIYFRARAPMYMVSYLEHDAHNTTNSQYCFQMGGGIRDLYFRGRFQPYAIRVTAMAPSTFCEGMAAAPSFVTLLDGANIDGRSVATTIACQEERPDNRTVCEHRFPSQD